MTPLGCLFGFLITLFGAVFIIAIVIFNKAKFLLYTLFPGWKRNKENKQQSYSNNNSNKENHNPNSHNSSSHNKVFDDDEGEYVDFEEIK